MTNQINVLLVACSTIAGTLGFTCRTSTHDGAILICKLAGRVPELVGSFRLAANHSVVSSGAHYLAELVANEYAELTAGQHRYTARNAAGEFYVSADSSGRIEKTTGQPYAAIMMNRADAGQLCNHLNYVRDCDGDWSVAEFAI